MTDQPKENQTGDEQSHIDFGRRVIRWTLSISVAMIFVWWALMRRSMPMVPAGFFIGVAAGIIRFKLHLAEIQDADDSLRTSPSGVEKPKDSQTAVSAVKGSLFRYGVALAAMLVAAALGRGHIPVIIASAIGILTPNLALISMTVGNNSSPDNSDSQE